MTDAELQRIKDDLAIVKQVIGTHLLHEPLHLRANLGLAFLGIAIAALTAFTGIAAQPTVAGSATHLLYVALIIVPVLLAFVAMAIIAHRQRSTAALPWVEYRRSLLGAAVAAPLYMGFIFWATHNGMSAGTITAVTFFLAGVFALLDAMFNPRRRYAVGWALSTMFAGIAIPLCSYSTAGILTGVWLFCGGLLTAIIMILQTKQSGVHNAN